MKRCLSMIALAIAALFNLFAPAANARSPETAAESVLAPAGQAEDERNRARPALWKVSDEDTTIYLFGTIHVLPDKVEWFDGAIAAAFAQSDVLVTEIVSTDDAAMQSLVVSKAMLPQGQTLRTLLPDDQRAEYEAALASFRIPPELFDRFEPWYAAVALSTLPLLQDGFSEDHGVEATLNSAAEARTLPHEALETPEFQLGLFDALPLDAQRSYLSEVIDQLPTIRTELAAMVEAWREGDPGKLAELMNADESNPVLFKVLLTDRNAAWAGWIESRLAKPGTVFLAVGAGHLGGPDSLQDQLRARDIAVERVQ